jgi:hypothetical protein
VAASAGALRREERGNAAVHLCERRGHTPSSVQRNAACGRST